MNALRPQPFAVLLARALEEYEAQRTVFDFPRRSFWKGSDRDLATVVHGEPAATPIGPAAGPHTQLAQNLALAWLAGARVLELKTVQVEDHLTIPRPCIDIANIGFNVEWSQELQIEDSLEQYVSGWFLIHILGNQGWGGEGWRNTVFDASIGYDLAGIQSDKVARFLASLRDVSAIQRLRNRLPPMLRKAADVEVPSQLASCVTLSTFHGCPPQELERMVEHLFDCHGLHVVLKLNPTLLGFEAVESLLRGRLGYDELELDRKAFDRDLQWDDAVGLLDRLSNSASRKGLELGVKLSNTLVVKNHKRHFSDPVMYLSGQPLHVIAIQLAHAIDKATAGRLPLSFSGGIDADNVAETVACGLNPVTACTDLLRPTGYRRLPRYLKAIVARMEQKRARNLAELIVASAGHEPEAASDPPTVPVAARRNLADYAARVADDPRYHATRNRETPRRTAVHLALFDCASCNACLVTCPNDAIFSVKTATQTLETWELVVRGGEVARHAATFSISEDDQWAVYADFCNACGNCDVFCPEHGGPHLAKPRFFGSRASFEAAAPQDGLLFEDGGHRVLARLEGVRHELNCSNGVSVFSDGVIEVELDDAHRVRKARVCEAREGHRLPLARYLAMRILRDAVLARVNPVSAPFLPSLRESAE